jgi:hypothetical protein
LSGSEDKLHWNCVVGHYVDRHGAVDGLVKYAKELEESELKLFDLRSSINDLLHLITAKKDLTIEDVWNKINTALTPLTPIKRKEHGTASSGIERKVAAQDEIISALVANIHLILNMQEQLLERLCKNTTSMAARDAYRDQLLLLQRIRKEVEDRDAKR